MIFSVQPTLIRSGRYRSDSGSSDLKRSRFQYEIERASVLYRRAMDDSVSPLWIVYSSNVGAGVGVGGPGVGDGVGDGDRVGMGVGVGGSVRRTEAGRQGARRGGGRGRRPG